MVRKTENAKAPEKRTDATDAPVTELAHVDGNTSTKTMEQMAGVSDEPYKPAENTDTGPSTQQQDVLDGLKEAKEDIKHPDRDKDVNPFFNGPGSDI